MLQGESGTQNGRATYLADYASASATLLPYAILIVALSLIAPATREQWAAADPIVRAARAHAGAWCVPVATLVWSSAWTAAVRPGRAAMRAALRSAATAVVVVAIGLPLLRLVVGPHLPGFIPPEESAAPGLLLGLSAGVIEEDLVRLLFLPVACRIVRATNGADLRWVAISLASGIFFAALHELDAATAFELRHFLTRALIPGFAFSMVAGRTGPAFVVVMHATAHLVIPELFA
jgi:hypothetical protein